jgi:hypothetical protein
VAVLAGGQCARLAYAPSQYILFSASLRANSASNHAGAVVPVGSRS